MYAHDVRVAKEVAEIAGQKILEEAWHPQAVADYVCEVLEEKFEKFGMRESE
jgi:hypothetical protein